MGIVKTASAFLHVTGEDGFIEVFKPGQVIPEALASQVTNPAAYTEVDDGAEAPIEPLIEPPVTPLVETPAVPVEPIVEQVVEPEGDKAYNDHAFASLQNAAKSRGLKADGNKETLIARLEADDRDKSQS